MSRTKTASSGYPAAPLSTSYVDGRRRSISPKMSSPTHTASNGVEYSFQKCAAMPRNGPRLEVGPRRSLNTKSQIIPAAGIGTCHRESSFGRQADVSHQSHTALVALNMTRPKEWRLSLLPRSLGFPSNTTALYRATFISSALEGFSLAAFRAEQLPLQQARSLCWRPSRLSRLPFPELSQSGRESSLTRFTLSPLRPLPSAPRRPEASLRVDPGPSAWLSWQMRHGPEKRGP